MIGLKILFSQDVINDEDKILIRLACHSSTFLYILKREKIFFHHFVIELMKY